MNLGIHTKRLIFYWVTSFVLATVSYFLMRLILPDHDVFGALNTMYLYHSEHPIQFIVIPCFFYGILATWLADSFSSKKLFGKIILTFVIIVLTIILSSPFGGMLWCFYYFKTGYFPSDWFSRMIDEGTSWGLLVGWLIVALSIPYNIICSVICFFLTQKGTQLFNKTKETIILE